MAEARVCQVDKREPDCGKVACKVAVPLPHFNWDRQTFGWIVYLRGEESKQNIDVKSRLF